MDLRQLRYFVGICDAGSITAAARRLHVAQPALSNHIANLETELDVKLLHRSSSGIVPTHRGEILYAAAQRVLREVSQIPDEVSSVEDNLGGRVVIGVSDGPTNIIGTKFIKNMLARYPKITMNYVTGHSANLHRKLVRGAVDAAFIVKEPQLGGVNHQAVLHDKIFVAMRNEPGTNDHNKPISIKRLRELQFIFSYGEGNSILTYLENSLKKVRFTPRVICEVESLSVIKELVAAGCACTLISWSAAYKEVEDKKIILRPIEGLSLEFSLELCTAIDRPPSATVSATIRVLLDTINELVESKVWRGGAKSEL
ncbi:MAG: LysR family transcriptional regulator [Gammaproteobacteria bacterium]|nr:LysR family transcriptional regulator [Gammaproteobacteria bacterium]